MRAPALFLTLLTASFAMSASVVGAEDPELMIAKPEWLRRPTGDEITGQFPSQALDRSISGRAEMLCTVRIDTSLEACDLTSEWPYGMGFGQAAVRMFVKGGRVRPRTVEGKPVGNGRIRISVRFINPTPSARYVIMSPIWDAAPDFEAMEAAWPMESSTISPATVVLRCSLAASGRLRDCSIGADSSGGVLRSRAKTLAQEQFRMRMTTEEAQKYVNSDVIVPLTFLDPASSGGQKRTVNAPQWITSINPEKILSVFPAQAAEAGVTAGRGTADCLVAPDGKLSDCKVGRESPAGMGFGASAVAIAGLMQMNPWSTDGRPVAGARIRLPIDFNLSPEVGVATGD